MHKLFTWQFYVLGSGLLSFLCRDAAETLQSQSYGKKDAQENLQNFLITNNHLPCETRILLSTILVYALLCQINVFYCIVCLGQNGNPNYSRISQFIEQLFSPTLSCNIQSLSWIALVVRNPQRAAFLYYDNYHCFTSEELADLTTPWTKDQRPWLGGTQEAKPFPGTYWASVESCKTLQGVACDQDTGIVAVQTREDIYLKENKDCCTEALAVQITVKVECYSCPSVAGWVRSSSLPRTTLVLV